MTVHFFFGVENTWNWNQTGCYGLTPDNFSSQAGMDKVCLELQIYDFRMIDNNNNKATTTMTIANQIPLTCRKLQNHRPGSPLLLQHMHIRQVVIAVVGRKRSIVRRLLEFKTLRRINILGRSIIFQKICCWFLWWELAGKKLSSFLNCLASLTGGPCL